MDHPRHPDYSDTLLDHFRSPRNVGEVERPDAAATVESPLHGDTLRLTFRLAGDRIVEARFLSRGCTVAIAAGSAATELLAGRTITEALLLTDDDVARALGGIPGNRRACSLLVARAVCAAFA
jgi:NifU-like protein involved in Fe-S cluster formation